MSTHGRCGVSGTSGASGRHVASSQSSGKHTTGSGGGTQVSGSMSSIETHVTGCGAHGSSAGSAAAVGSGVAMAVAAVAAAVSVGVTITGGLVVDAGGVAVSPSLLSVRRAGGSPVPSSPEDPRSTANNSTAMRPAPTTPATTVVARIRTSPESQTVAGHDTSGRAREQRANRPVRFEAAAGPARPRRIRATGPGPRDPTDTRPAGCRRHLGRAVWRWPRLQRTSVPARG